MRLYDYEQPSNRSIAERNKYTARRIIGTYFRIWFFVIKLIAAGVILLGLFIMAASILSTLVHAKDSGQWENTPPEVREWYSHLMQPDLPTASCCGEADAYWADAYEIDKETGQYIAIITDDRDNEKLKRVPIPVGTRVLIPNKKLNDASKQQNPTGHGIVFLSAAASDAKDYVSRGDYVYCFMAPGGV